jgi:hypothetical protein
MAMKKNGSEAFSKEQKKMSNEFSVMDETLDEIALLEGMTRAQVLKAIALHAGVAVEEIKVFSRAELNASAERQVLVCSLTKSIEWAVQGFCDQCKAVIYHSPNPIKGIHKVCTNCYLEHRRKHEA